MSCIKKTKENGLRNCHCMEADVPRVLVGDKVLGEVGEPVIA